MRPIVRRAPDMSDHRTGETFGGGTTWRRALGVALLALGTPSATLAQPRPPRATPFARGDLDGDGYGDLVVPGQTGIQVFFGGPGGVGERPVVLPHPFPFSGQETRFADAIEDLDGDGDAELVLVDFAADPWAVGVSVNVHVYEGGTRTLGAERWTGGWRTTYGAYHDAQGCLRAAGDVDGDGRADVVAAGFVLFGGAPGRPPRSHAIEDPTTAGERRRAVLPISDTDGDGRAELWTAPLRRDTPTPLFPSTGLRGGDGARLSIGAGGAWRESPMPLSEAAVGALLADAREGGVAGRGRLVDGWARRCDRRGTEGER
jgi:hypothetical protein